MKTTILLAAAAFVTFAFVSGAKEKSGVAAQLKGKLVEMKDGDLADAEISSDMKYYVLYHSASW